MEIESNVYILIGSTIVATFGWFASKNIENIRVRRAVKTSIIYLILPIPFLGHPLFYYQVCSLLIYYIIDFNLQGLLVLLIIWLGLVVISQYRIKSH